MNPPHGSITQENNIPIKVIVASLYNLPYLLHQPIHILSRIVDIETRTERATDPERLMEYIRAVMSRSDTDTCISKCLCDIIRMMVVEYEREYSETMLGFF